MINFGIGLILGILIGAYVASPIFRKKINDKILNKGATVKTQSLKPNPCKACNGTGFQTLKSGLKVECPVCKGTGI